MPTWLELSLSLSLSLVQNGKSSSADNFVVLIAAAKMTIKCFSQYVIVYHRRHCVHDK
jgi:hypothetical protein